MHPKIVTKNDVSPDDLQALAGRTGTFELEGLNFGVDILAARIRFGHLDFRVAPRDGSGAKWIESHRVVLD